MRAIVVLALLGSVARAEPTPAGHVVLSIDGWVTPAADAPLPDGVTRDRDTLVLPSIDAWFQYKPLDIAETCADFRSRALGSGTYLEDWPGYPADVPDRIAFADGDVTGCLTAGGRAIQFRFFSPTSAELPLDTARHVLTVLRDAFALAGTHLTLPASGLVLDLPTHAFTLSREAAPELGGDADVLVHSGGTPVVKIAARPQHCAQIWPIVEARISLHPGGEPTGAAAGFSTRFRVDNVEAPHHAFICADLGTRSITLEIVEPLAAIDDAQLVIAAVSHVLRTDGKPHDREETPPVHEGFAYLMVLTRIYIEGGIARTSFTSASGGRFGIESVAGPQVGTHLALGFGAAGGLDEDLHASFDLHLKGGIGHGLPAHSGLFVIGLAGLARSATHGDATTGGYLGGELDLRLDYVELAGGVTTRGQHARIELIKRRREQSFGVGAGGEWIHDGQVQLFALYLALAI